MMTSVIPSKDQFLKTMLKMLEEMAWPHSQNDVPPDPSATSLPENDVSILKIKEQPVGLGNRIGVESKNSFALTALKGGRLNALVRFQVWGKDFSKVENKIKDLQVKLLGADQSLREHGFLQLKAEESALADFVEALEAWRKTADYQVLYEFYYDDTEGAEGLIAQIPVHIDDAHNETIVVADRMVRWSRVLDVPLNGGLGNVAVGTPPLEIRGSVGQSVCVRAIASLATLPEDWDGAGVVLEVLQDDATVQQKTFDSLRNFLSTFAIDQKPIWLGGQSYQSGLLKFPSPDFPNPIVLKGGADIFRIRYAALGLENNAVVYLKGLL